MSEEQMKAALHRYIDAWNAGDAEAIAALFAEDAVIEDPYGTPPMEDREAVRGFFQNGVAAGVRLTLDSPIRASYGDRAAMAFTVSMPDLSIKVIDVMRFNKSGLITHMQAFWGNTDMDRSAASSG